MSDRPQWLRVALVLRPHGVAGEVGLEVLSQDQDRIRPGLKLRGPKGELVVGAVRGGPGQLICAFEGVEDREQAQELTGSYLEIAREEGRRLPAGEYFHFQLLGLRVEDERGRRRGEVVDVEAYPAHDVYVVREGEEELRVPAVREAVLGIDLEQGRLTVAGAYLEGWADAG